MNHYIDRAIELAIANVEDGGTPYGAVLVCNNEIIGEGVNTLHKVNDVSGHAEMIAIRIGQKTLKSNDLSQCTIYASGHPCPMCLGAIAIAGIQTVVYANSVQEGADVGLTISQDIYEYLKGDLTCLPLNIEHYAIPKDSRDPMKVYQSVKNK